MDMPTQNEISTTYLKSEFSSLLDLPTLIGLTTFLDLPTLHIQGNNKVIYIQGKVNTLSFEIKVEIRKSKF